MIIDTIVFFFNAFGLYLILILLGIKIVSLWHLMPDKFKRSSRNNFIWYFMPMSSREQYIPQNEYRQFLRTEKVLTFLNILFYGSILFTVAIKFLLYKLN